jgi:hypothetical protein
MFFGRFASTDEASLPSTKLRFNQRKGIARMLASSTTGGLMMTTTTQHVRKTTKANRAALSRLAAATALVTALSACSAAPSPSVSVSLSPSPSPSPMGHCSHVYGLWLRYLQAFVDHTGERARAEKMLFDCQQGRYDTDELERILMARGVSTQSIEGAEPILPP